MDDWSITWGDGYPEAEGHHEALTTLGNGRFATRGARHGAVADGTHYPGTYLAGGYNRASTEVAGKAIENEDLVNWPNWLGLRLSCDGAALDRRVVAQSRTLNLREGTLRIVTRLRDAEGRTMRLTEVRLVSMAHPYLAAAKLEIVPEDWDGTLAVESFVDGGVENAGVARYRDLERRHLDVLSTGHERDIGLLLCRTRASGLGAAMAISTVVREGEEERPAEAFRDRERAGTALTLLARKGSAIVLEKTAAFVTDRDRAIASPAVAATQFVQRAPAFAALADDHGRSMRSLWDDFDIALADGSSHAQVSTRFQLFHVMQTLSPHTAELDVGAPARGWHGEAYRGHIFWDEVFIFRVLNLRAPRLGRELLRYRHRRLPAARWLARDEGLPGAMFPWQSGSDGREESQALHLNPRSGRWIPDATHRQRHVGLAIAYNVWTYYRATNDLEFMVEAGAELLGEIARFFSALATWDDALGRYRIRHVMGPDEFHTGYPQDDVPQGIDDNAYTNVLCAWMLTRTVDVFENLPPRRRDRLMAALGLTEADIQRWLDVSERLYVPFLSNGLIAQFEGYEALEELDWDHYREKYGDVARLDRILEAEGKDPNAYKASKQADVLMLPFLFTADTLRSTFEQLGYTFDAADLPRLVQYYDTRTTHGSTLSNVVHAWVLARTDRRRSWDFFCDALRADLDDVQGGTTAEGIHLGAMCGTLDMMQASYLGCAALGDALYIDPLLPEPLDGLRTRVHYRGHDVTIDATKAAVTLTNETGAGEGIWVSYRGRRRQLPPGSSTVFRLVPPRADRGSARDAASA